LVGPWRSGGRDAVTGHGWSRLVAPSRGQSRGFKKKKIVYFGLARARSLGRLATFGCAKFFSPFPKRLKCGCTAATSDMTKEILTDWRLEIRV